MESKYLVYGKKVVQHVLETKPNLIIEIWIEAGEERVWEFSIPENIKVVKKNISEIDRVADGNHQGFVAFMKEYNYVPFAEIVDEDKILILDRIQDPHNFGAIIRSAALFGYKNILLLDHNQCPVTPAVVKTSAGTLYDVQIARVSNLSNAIKALQENNHWIYSTFLSEDSQELNSIEFTKRNAIIIGNECEGISQKIAKQSDFRIKIKTNDAIDSLNASVATGVILFFATLNQ
jgi:23S rRNA (guanosine2251-2'-O)-methyltransferase